MWGTPCLHNGGAVGDQAVYLEVECAAALLLSDVRDVDAYLEGPYVDIPPEFSRFWRDGEVGYNELSCARALRDQR